MTTDVDIGDYRYEVDEDVAEYIDYLESQIEELNIILRVIKADKDIRSFEP